MRNFFVGLILFFCASVANAAPLRMYKQSMQTTDLATATAINTTAYTGWMNVSDKRSIVLEITYVNSSATAVTTKCWTSDSTSTANGSGFELHILNDSGTVGTSDSVQHIWSNAVSGDENWTWKISNLPHYFINCGFDGTGADGSDTVVVRYRGETP